VSRADSAILAPITSANAANIMPAGVKAANLPA